MDSDKIPMDDPKLEPEVPQLESTPNSPRSSALVLPPPMEQISSQSNDRKATPKPEPSDSTTHNEERLDSIPTPRAGTPTVPASRPESSLLLHMEDAPMTLRSSQRSRRASPMDPQSYSNLDRPLNVTDALSYLDAVKVQFQNQPDVYNHFLDIMKEFKNEQIDTPGVIQRVSYLFNGHPSLIQGFNTFLPSGYRIECTTDAHDASFITVTTPSGTTTQATNPRPRRSTDPPVAGASHQSLGNGYANVEHGSPEPRLYAMDGQAIEPAVQYVQKIKQRCDHEVYRQFLDILAQYHHTPESIDEEEVLRQVARLFKDAPDLRADFRIFMPGKGQQVLDDGPTSHDKSRRKLDVVANSMSHSSSLPQKRKRKPAEKEREREKEALAVKAAPPQKKSKLVPAQDLTPLSYNPKHVAVAPPSPRRSSRPVLPPQPPRMPVANDESQFFDRVKHAFQDRNIYNEFLKIVNLFAQDYIDTARLVKESRNFLGETELFKQFCDILGWDEKKEREHYLAEQNAQSSWTKPAIAALPERPGRIDLSEKFGSYRKVTASEANVACSGRDEMCRSVLNDEWVSHPTWTSEDSGFRPHKKNMYEEALHRSEEERHEYDFHIEAVVRTITMLEPINNKIAQMSPEDRGTFKVKPNLGGSWKAIHQRVIKKIYGREAGLEVIQAMQETPALAIPVVLQRLKQKEEEWKRAQREWNKVWREVDARNYAKSLDHQAIEFKAADKKAITAKTFLNQIESAREEQLSKRASLIDPLFARTRPRHQLAFLVDNEGILQDIVKLTLSFVDRAQAQLNLTERKRVESFLRVFFPVFFTLNETEFNAGVASQETVESDTSDIDVASVTEEIEVASVASTSRAGKNGRKVANVISGGDLRKKLLKSEQAKSTGRKTRAKEAPSPAVSRFASPAYVDEERTDPLISSRRHPKTNNIFFTNTAFYTLIRLVHLLYARLELLNDLASKLMAIKGKDRRTNPAAIEANLVATNGVDVTAENLNLHYYDFLLVTCERLFDNYLEQAAFEDQMRAIFGTRHAYKIFTIDKVIGAIVKQVQSIISDPKSQELLEILKRERALVNPTTQDHINSRRNAEKVLGPDENVFRIDWLSDSKTITFQLIGKDDSGFDDEVSTSRWQSYIDAYVSADATEGVSHARVKRPYLRRNLPQAIREVAPEISSQDSLEIKVCVRTYRLFYVSHTEDLMWRWRSKEEMEKVSRQLKRRNNLRRAWVEKAKSS